MMATAQMAILAPLANPLPSPPSGEAFTPEQWTTLMAIMDTVIPSVRRQSVQANPRTSISIPDVQYSSAIDHIKTSVSEAPSSEELDKYMDERPSENKAFEDVLKRTLIHYARDDVRKGLIFVLSALK